MNGMIFFSYISTFYRLDLHLDVILLVSFNLDVWDLENLLVRSYYHVGRKYCCNFREFKFLRLFLFLDLFLLLLNYDRTLPQFFQFITHHLQLFSFQPP